MAGLADIEVPTRLLSAREVCAILGCGYDWLRTDGRRQSVLLQPAVYVGRQPRYSPVQLQLWIDAAAEACPVTRADAEERWRTLLASGQLGRVTVGAALLEERA